MFMCCEMNVQCIILLFCVCMYDTVHLFIFSLRKTCDFLFTICVLTVLSLYYKGRKATDLRYFRCIHNVL